MSFSDNSLMGLWLGGAGGDRGRSYLTEWFPRLAASGPTLIALRAGLNVIYGRNGAGKSQLLSAIACAAEHKMSAYEGFVYKNPRVAKDKHSLDHLDSGTAESLDFLVGDVDSLWSMFLQRPGSDELNLGYATGFAPQVLTRDEQQRAMELIAEFTAQKTVMITRAVMVWSDRTPHKLGFGYSQGQKQLSPDDMHPPRALDFVPILLPDAEAPLVRAHAAELRSAFLQLTSELASEFWHFHSVYEAQSDGRQQSLALDRFNQTLRRQIEAWESKWRWSPLLNRRNLPHLGEGWFNWSPEAGDGLPASGFLNALGNDLLYLPTLKSLNYLDAEEYDEFAKREVPNAIRLQADLLGAAADANQYLPPLTARLLGLSGRGHVDEEGNADGTAVWQARQFELRLRSLLRFLPNMQHLSIELSAFFGGGEQPELHPNLYLKIPGAWRKDVWNQVKAPEASKTSTSATEFRWLHLVLSLLNANIPDALSTAVDALTGRSSDIRQQWIVIDEPEAGLHRSAEAAMSTCLASDDWKSLGVMVVATHCPELLAVGDNVMHIEQGIVRPFTPTTHSSLQSLGLRPQDLLGGIRTFLLVEGEHEKVVFEEVLGDELRSISCHLLVARGGKNMRDVFDSQILFDFSDASLMCLMDNLNRKLVEEYWFEAQRIATADPNRAGIYIREKLPRSQSGENRFMGQFMTAALQKGLQHRVSVFGFDLPDIVCYLDSHHFGLKKPWDQLLEEFGNGENLKEWAFRQYGAKFDLAKISKAARNMHSLPTDFTDLLNAIRTSGELAHAIAHGGD